MLHNEGFDVTAAELYSLIGSAILKFLFFKADMDSRYPFDDSSFDYAFCIDGPGHAENIYHSFREFSRVLKKGSLFTLSCKNYSKIECTLRNVFYGVLEPVKPYTEKERKYNGHINRPPYAL